MDNPVCEQYTINKCPRSETRMLAEHGPPQAALYWTFVCKNCKHITIVWNPQYVEAAKRGEIDREMGRLMDKRFQGLK